jgi:hypothetical protein
MSASRRSGDPTGMMRVSNIIRVASFSLSPQQRHAIKQITAIPGARALSRSTSRSPGKSHVADLGHLRTIPG